jgi:hypothetical protein
MNNEKATQLRTLLKLENLPRIYFARVIGLSAYTVYFIFYDTRRPYVSITTAEAHKKEFPPVTPFKSSERLSLTILRPLEDFHGSLKGSLFIRIDLSGRFGDRRQYHEHTDSTILYEDMTLKDFKSAAAISAFTKRHLGLRKGYLQGNLIKYTRLMDCKLDRTNDWVLFDFLSIATPNTDSKKEADPFKDFKLINDPSKVYELKIRLDGFFAWLLGTLPDGQEVTKQDILDAMDVCSLKIWSSSPAYHWQSMNYNVTQLGAALYPTKIAPKYWNKFHGDTFLDKHLANLFRNIDFYAQPMASMLNKRLRDVHAI